MLLLPKEIKMDLVESVWNKNAIHCNTLRNIFLDLNEAIALMKELGFNLTDEQVTEVFKKFDSDNSGELDKAECKQLVAQMMPNFFA